jgi:hypothetical protein
VRPLALALVLIAAPGVLARARADDRPEALVAKVLAAYGGRPALEKARVVRQEGTVTSVMHDGTGKLARLFARPGSLRVEVAYPGDPPEVRVVHAGYGDRNGVDVTGSVRHVAMILQAARLALPLSLAEKEARLSDRGTVERDGQRRRVLALALPHDLELLIEIDPATARIVRSAGTMPSPAGTMEFATIYSEWKKVGGVLFATHEESFARGQHTGATSLSKIELLGAPPAGAFDEPL